MIIPIKVCFMLLFVFYAGLGVVGLFQLIDNKEKLSRYYLITAVIGYAASQFLFQLFYSINENSLISFFITLILLTAINLIYFFLLSRREHPLSVFIEKFSMPRKDLYILLILVLIFILSSWQYVAIGEKNYLHSGNEDFFDGINGGQSYLDNTPLRYMPEDFSGWIRLQYSSQAFTRILLKAGGVDGFLFQAILNLFLTAIGIYWLVITVFHGNGKTALLASFWSVCANFYLTTFLNGHIGSLMYGSMAPAFIGVIILWSRKEVNSYWLILAALLLYSIHITYPGPIFFLLIPAAVLIIHKRIFQPLGFTKKILFFFGFNNQENAQQFKNRFNWLRVISIGIIVLIISVLFTIIVYNYFEPRRINAILRTNVSWKISLFKEMIMIFWGIYPSGSTGILSALPIFISNDIINTMALIIAGSLTVSAFIAGIKNRLNVNRYFLFLYTVFYIPFFIMMRYFWGSPYYFYKFLYVNYFIVVVILFLWLSDFLRSTKKKVIKNTFIGLLVLIGSLNIIWNISIDYDYYTRPYNDKQRIEDFFSHVNKQEISQSYIDIPNFLVDLVFRYIFIEHGYSPRTSRKDAKYIIQLENYGNVYQNSVSKSRELFNNGLLKLFEPPSDNQISTSTMYEPEHAGKININWIGNELSLKRGILLSSLSDLIGFLEKSGNLSRTFIDITDKDTYILLDESLKSKGIKLQRSALNADWFIRIKGGRTIISDTKDSKEIWSNEFFKIISVKDGTKIKINELPEIPNFSGIVNEAKLNGNKIYIDIPSSEHLYLYLKQFLREQGINVVDNPEKTEIFCRCIFNKDFEKLNYQTYSHVNEKVLWQSVSFNVFQRPWEIQLVKVPLKDRILNSNKRLEENLPFTMAANYSKGDFQIKISNLSSRAEYLRILVSPGPSIEFSPFVLKIENVGNGKKELINIDNPVTLVDLNIGDIKEKPDTTLELSIQGQNLFGHSLLPLDDRYLNYQIQALELTDQVDHYSNYLLSVLNNKTPSRLDRFLRLFIREKEFNDIINKKDSALVSLGIGWFPPEEHENKVYRWVGANPAEIILNNIDIRRNILEVNLEPGPGCGDKPLNLKIFDKTKILINEIVKGTQKLQIQIPKESFVNGQKQITLKFVVETENKKIISDPRILNYRVFNISLRQPELKKNDIIELNNLEQIQIGKGWFPYETYNNESFRWVGRNFAEILITNLDTTSRKVKMNIEPGPGCAGLPLQVKIYFNNNIIAKKSVVSRENLIIDIPPQLRRTSNKPLVIKLLPVSKNAVIPSDKRILNFRIFSISIDQ